MPESIHKRAAEIARAAFRLWRCEPETFRPDDLDAARALDWAYDLARACAALHRWSEAACNGVPRYDATAGRVLASWTDADAAKCERETQKLEAKALAAIAGLFGDKAARLGVEFQRDPRGAMVKIYASPEERERGASPRMWA